MRGGTNRGGPELGHNGPGWWVYSPSPPTPGTLGGPFDCGQSHLGGRKSISCIKKTWVEKTGFSTGEHLALLEQGDTSTPCLPKKNTGFFVLCHCLRCFFGYLSVRKRHEQKRDNSIQYNEKFVVLFSPDPLYQDPLLHGGVNFVLQVSFAQVASTKVTSNNEVVFPKWHGWRDKARKEH